MITLNTTHTIFSQITAKQVAAELNKDNDSWTYKVKNNPNPDGPKTAIIKIYDEDGKFVGTY